MTSSRFSLKALKATTNSSSTPTISTTQNGGNSRNNSASTPTLPSDQQQIHHHLDIATDRSQTTNGNNRNSIHSHQSYQINNNTTPSSATTPRTPAATIGVASGVSTSSSYNHTITVDSSYVGGNNHIDDDLNNWKPISRNNSKKSLSSSFRKLLFGCRNVRGDEEVEQEKKMISRSSLYLPDDQLFKETSETLVDDAHHNSAHVMALVSPRGKSSPRTSANLSPARHDAEMKRRSVESPTMMLIAANQSPSSSHHHHTTPSGGSSNYSLRNKIFAGAIPEERAEEVILNSDYSQKVQFHFEGQFEVKQCHNLETISDLTAFKDCITPFVKIEWFVEFFNTQGSLKNKMVPMLKPTPNTDTNTWKQSKKTTVTCLEVGRKEVSWNEVLDFSITVDGYLHRNVLEFYKKNSESSLLDQVTKPYGENVIGILRVKSHLYDYDDLLLQENIISHHTMEFPITLKTLMKNSGATSPSLKIESYIENFGNSNSPLGTVSTPSHVKLQSVGTSKGTMSPTPQESAISGFGENTITMFEKNQPVNDYQMVQDSDSEIILTIVPVIELSYYVKMLGTSV
ncbi:hypothetical protein NAEGRDRAFT_80241 [Naegleria gruberi]|uniref:Uncharacterized protein n=1 Tax=Naegleria gruberi TaxID=5762 RepID=D2VJY5_NAEGR|nr:uncharacterized protein NAEGRDRAFT_80241 [Naegleria gruberi]EFC42771.1 hypothetical protein NAEGRDRAFT_80241 [Naegleria gruberi]|eukprot:XP_002675515.1 hypothetical protein NAEGRDRAFT_80241 [Naegleria gruberi strain NEG-M]